MKVYQLYRKQFLPISPAEAWEFFSSPRNLGKITPERMNFVILSQTGGEQMHEGQQIRYNVTVLPFIRVSWLTEITEVNEPYQFTDVQRSGPYALWKHTHTFKAVNGGVEMTDEVSYALPLGPLGQLAHALFVRREVNRIFDHRYRVLEDLFRQQ